MNKYQKETEKILLSHEEEVLNELKKTYTNALKEIKFKVKQLQADVDILEKSNLENKSLLQSKIYQLNYQKAMEEQINSILDVVKNENVRNTQSFLTKMYEDSFLGINYHLQQKGIPVIMPINNKMIVKTINEPTEKLNFKDRLYKHNKEFKKTVKSEISRGLALGSSYKDIAEQLSLVTQVDLNKAYRIARTEGGRVSSESKLESMHEAKKAGADIVKVWDSTLDHKTRELHAILDQQWEDLDEPFVVQGMEAQAPHGFGRADMDINCRCVLLSVPRWDLEGEVVKYDNEHDYLIKASNYKAWKDGYYEKIEELDIVKSVIAEATERVNDYKKFAKAVSGSIDKTPVKSNVNDLNDLESCRKKLELIEFDFDTESLKELDFDLIKENTQQLYELFEKYPFVNNHKRQNFRLNSSPQNSLAYTNGWGICLNSDFYKSYEVVVKKELKLMAEGWTSPFKEEYAGVATLTHEFGHLICNELVKQYYDDNPEIYQKSLKDISSSNKIRKQVVDGFIKEIKAVAKEENKDAVLKISEYGRTNSEEMFAELFMKSQLGKSDEFSDALLKWLEMKKK